MRIPHLRGRFGRKRGWRRRIAAVALLLILCAVAGYLYLANPQRLSGFAARLLRDMTGAEVAIDEARIGIDGKVYLTGLRLRVPGVAGDAGRLFEAQQVTIDHRLTSLLRGRFDATSLVVFGPTLVLVQDVATERYNYQVLRDLRAKGPIPKPPDRLPEVFVRQGVIEFAELEGDRFLSLGKVNIDGKLTQIAEQPGAYYFALRQLSDERAAAQLTGRFSLRDLSVSAELDSFSLNNPYGNILPRKLRAWWQGFNPAGSLPIFRIAYDPDPAIGLYAIIEVRDVELSLPYAERPDQGTEPAYPRMRGVSGTFTLIRDTVRIEALRGTIEGIGYQIDGQIDGLDKDAPFRFQVRTDEFHIPADRSVYSLPREVEKELRRFGPTGRFQAEATIQRRRSGTSIDYDGKLFVRGANIRYARFAYPLVDVHGEIRFTNELIDVVKLDGHGPNGGRVVVTGSIAPPGDGAAVELHIIGTDLPVDEHVLDNIEPQYRKVIEMLADRTQHARMVELGVIRSAETPRAEASEAPDRKPEESTTAQTAPKLFDLGGSIDIKIHVSRALGSVQPYVMKAGIDVAGVNVMFRHWPYPLHLTSGTIRIEPRAVHVEDVHATGPHGGRGRMSGAVTKVSKPGEKERWDPDLQIADAQLPLDALLLATIPSPHDHWLREFRVQGKLDATGRIFALPHGEVTFTVDTRVRGATANPFGSGFTVTDLTGKATIQRDRVTVTDMAGKRGDGRVMLGGEVNWSSQPSTLTLDVVGRGLQFEPQLLGLIRPEFGGADRVRAMFDTYKPTGRFDVNFAYASGGEAGPRFDLALQPKDIAFDLRGKRVALNDVAGTVRVTGDTIKLEDMSARFAHGKVSGSGLINTGPRPAAAINFTAEATKIDDLARAVLPAVVTRTIDGLELQGGYIIPRARYVQRPAAPQDQESRLEFEGTVQMHHASANVGVPITELDGDLYVMVKQPPGEGTWPHLDIRLDAKRLLAAGRVVEPLQLHLLTAEHREDLLHIQQLRGVCYGGLLVGEGWIDMARDGMYRLGITLSEVSLTPFMTPETKETVSSAPDAAVTQDPTEPVMIAPDTATPDPHADRSEGVLTASLTIEGTPGEVESRRGRGALDIRNAALYELPLAMAALQIANLTLPQSNSFDRAAARFLLDGDTVRFDTLRFEAPTVEMSGEGTMQLSTRKLDLRLVSRNPAAPQLGAISELFNVLKDELITIRVNGTLEEPQARVMSFRGMKRSVDRVLGDEKPKRPSPASGKRRHRPTREPSDADDSVSTSGQ